MALRDVPEGLERSESNQLRFQRGMWTAQRVAWVLIGIALVAAAFGVAGERPAQAVLRPAIIYAGVFLLLRFTGKHSLGSITTFDFVLLLIISESVSAALLAGDDSIPSALIAAATLVFVDVILSLIKQQSKAIDRVLEDEPIVLVAHGKCLHDRMKKERVDEDDILESARLMHGLERMDQIRFAVLERGGDISIIPEK
jgi:uncharacterized membrane protein YcaP (DUF421 family)